MIRPHYIEVWGQMGIPGINLPVLIAFILGLIVAFTPLVPAALVLLPFLAIILFLEPLAGIMLMLFAAPWGALESVLFGQQLLDSGQILFFVTTAAWLAHGAIRRRIWFPAPRFLLPLALFIVIASLSLLSAPSVMLGFVELFKWIEIAVVALIVTDRIEQRLRRTPAFVPQFWRRQGGWRSLLFIILLAALSQAAIGVWQFGLRETGPEHFQIVGGRFYRAYGTFEQPNPFGGFMAWMAALAIGAAFGELMHRLKSRRLDAAALGWLAFLFAASFLFLSALVASWSRGAWMGFGVAAAVALLLLPRRRALGATLFCGTFLLALMAWQSGILPVAITDRLAGFTQDLTFGDVRGVDINDANYAVLERLAHWQSAVAMAQANLWSGVGFGNYEAAYGRYALINWPYALGHAHNYYLNIFAETGIIGLIAYLGFWAVIISQSLQLVQRCNWPERGVALGLVAVWLSLSVHHLLDKLYVNNLYLYIGALLGVQHILHERFRGKV